MENEKDICKVNEKELLGEDLTFEQVIKMRAQYPQWNELEIVDTF
jgi:hypothetical protein